ncbi:MAG: hypothetical protein IJW82_03790 [Clostridia bacterium]|nr:hypothetical protein [Clostridia bacterium]
MDKTINNIPEKLKTHKNTNKKYGFSVFKINHCNINNTKKIKNDIMLAIINFLFIVHFLPLLV